MLQWTLSTSTHAANLIQDCSNRTPIFLAYIFLGYYFPCSATFASRSTGKEDDEKKKTIQANKQCYEIYEAKEHH